MNVQLNDSGVPILREKTMAQKIKSKLLWIILIILAVTASLLLYICFAASNEMGALSSFKAEDPEKQYYTMEYINFDYSKMLNKNLVTNNDTIQHFKNKIFSPVAASFLPGSVQEEREPVESAAMYGRTFISTYFKARTYTAPNTQIAMIISKPEEGYKSWNIVDLADVGITSSTVINPWFDNSFQLMAANYAVSEGINQEYFSVSLISTPEADCKVDKRRETISPFMAVRLLLDRSATVDNGIDILEDYNIDFSNGKYHFFISQADGDSAVIEYINGEMAITRVDGKTSKSHHQICTNKMESKLANTSDFGGKYRELKIYEEYDKALSSFDLNGGIGISQGYARVVIKNTCSTPSDTESGTQYFVFYDIYKSSMQIVIRNESDEKKIFKYDITK